MRIARLPLGFTAAAALAAAALPARADAILDWNAKSAEFVAEAKLGTPPAIRAMAIVQTAAYQAARAASPGAGADAAIAAANRATLARLMPAAQASIDAHYRAALAGIADGPAKDAGIAAGLQAADSVFASRAADATLPPGNYRPHAAPGTYVPTAAPAAAQWPQRSTWLLASAAQVRPGPPPPLESRHWASHYNEVRALGGRASSRRTDEQAEVARFWGYSLPAIYFGVVRTVANQPGRSVVDNARLYAAVAQAMDDAMIAVFDAKYAFNFWRPSTAIRNGDIDGHDLTEREPGWAPLLDEPMHPEYPSAHAILAGTVAAILKAEVGQGAMPLLATSSPTARGATRRWRTADDFAREVEAARVYAGIHYRFSVETGGRMGQRIGELAAARFAPGAR